MHELSRTNTEPEPTAGSSLTHSSVITRLVAHTPLRFSASLVIRNGLWAMKSQLEEVASVAVKAQSSGSTLLALREVVV